MRRPPWESRLGIDSDNDSAFMNPTVVDYCGAQGLKQTRSRAYRKNDQAWVEQKNGAVVRRLVGYGRLSGLAATEALAKLYAVSRLYINYFQPSFKLKSKTREGALVRKLYHAPATPCDRLLTSPHLSDGMKSALKAQFESLDPVRLLRDIRDRQQKLSELASCISANPASKAAATDVATFLGSLATAWKEGEVRPTHRKRPAAVRWWRTRADPFANVWPIIEDWLVREPTLTAKELLVRLAESVPDASAGEAQRRTLQRRIKTWRAERAKDLVFGHVHDHDRLRTNA